MPTLHDELQRYLHGWQDHLPRAWRQRLDGVRPNFGAVPQNASLDGNARIVPAQRNGRGAFYALEGIDPADVAVVVVGNDPYPDPNRATGRSFEQGDLTSWPEDLAEPGRVTPSLLSLVCAAAALLPNAEGLRLDRCSLRGRRETRRETLRSGLQNGQVTLPPPQSMFENLTGQGVLWINCTPTISVHDTGRRRRGSTWRAVDGQRKWHQALWRPITNAIVSLLVEEAQRRPIVFALFGHKAKELRKRIEARGRCLDVCSENLRFVESGHPSRPGNFFCLGNPFGRINDELTAGGCDPIDWCGPPAGQTAANDSPCLSMAPRRTPGRPGTPSARAIGRFSAATSVRSIAIMDRTIGKYRTTLRHLAER